MALIVNTPYRIQAPVYSDVILGTQSATVESYWPMDSFTSSVTPDISGNSKNLTASTGITQITGKVNQALDFNGGTNTFANNTSYTFPAGYFDQISIEAWISLRTEPSVARSILDLNNGSNSNLGIEFNAVNGTNYPNGPGSIQLDVDGGTVTANNVLPLNTWVHVVATFDRTLTNNNIDIFINGTLNTTGTRTISQTSSIANVEVGRKFDGLVDELVVYKGILSQADITQHYQAGL